MTSIHVSNDVGARLNFDVVFIYSPNAECTNNLGGSPFSSKPSHSTSKPFLGPQMKRTNGIATRVFNGDGRFFAGEQDAHVFRIAHWWSIQNC